MSVKLQINSLEALERLIGGDSELEVELRNSIVQQFVKKYLKGVANEDLVNKAKSGILNEVKKEFFEEVNSGRFYTTDVLKPEYLVDLKKDLKEQANSEFTQIVKEAIETQKIKETLDYELNRATSLIHNTLTDANINDRLNRMVDAKLKQKLGL